MTPARDPKQTYINIQQITVKNNVRYVWTFVDVADQIFFGWDTKTNWFFKTLNFFQNQDIKNLKEFNNFDYPHLGAYIWSFFWQFPFGSYEYLGRIFYVFLYVLSIFSISNCLKLEIYEKIIFSILLIFIIIYEIYVSD